MNKTVLITGASGGIGSACARLFAENGYSVAVHYFKNEQAAQILVDELCGLGCKAIAFSADLSNEAQTEAMIKKAEEQLGVIGVLINNAGVAQQKLFTDTTQADYDFIFGANVKSAVNCSRAVLPAMIRAKQGRIINISSMWGISGASCEVLYSASKAAVIGFTKALAKEVGPSGITVNCIAPGVINTKMNAKLSAEDIAALADETPLCRIGEPIEVAQTALFLAENGASFITGQTISVDGGIIL